MFPTIYTTFDIYHNNIHQMSRVSSKTGSYGDDGVGGAPHPQDDVGYHAAAARS